MSGLGELGLEYAFATGVSQVAQRDIDQYDFISIGHPSVDTAWYAAGTVAGTAVTALALKNQLSDYPRNIAYCFTGGTSGGTITVNGIDQFGVAFTEKVALGSVAGGGTTYGTVIAAKFLSGTVNPNTSTTGTYTVGNGTASNGSAASNWFGLMTKIGGTADVKNIRWDNNGTVTGLNKGTAMGTLIDANRHAFQGTSGVAITDSYAVILKPTFDNSGKGLMSGL
jgi:hypothetical protein